MAYRTDRMTTADWREVSQKAKANSKERTCPNCNRNGALKVSRTTDARLIAEYGYVCVDRKCRWCGYKDQLHETVQRKE